MKTRLIRVCMCDSNPHYKLLTTKKKKKKTGVDFVQEKVLGQGPQDNESAFEQAKDEKISDCEFLVYSARGGGGGGGSFVC